MCYYSESINNKIDEVSVQNCKKNVKIWLSRGLATHGLNYIFFSKSWILS